MEYNLSAEGADKSTNRQINKSRHLEIKKCEILDGGFDGGFDGAKARGRNPFQKAVIIW